MSNNNRGSRAALAAMVVAVMAMSAVSAEAAVKQAAKSSAAKKSGSQTVQMLRRAVANTLIRYWEPFGELPTLNIPRGGFSGTK